MKRKVINLTGVDFGIVFPTFEPEPEGKNYEKIMVRNLEIIEVDNLDQRPHYFDISLGLCKPLMISKKEYLLIFKVKYLGDINVPFIERIVEEYEKSYSEGRQPNPEKIKKIIKSNPIKEFVGEEMIA